MAITDTARLTAHVQSTLDKWVASRRGHSAVVSVRSDDDRFDTTVAAGVATAGDPAPMSADTPYYAASITKMYTAAVIMRLAREGQIDLDAPMVRFLPPYATGGIHVMNGIDYTDQIRVFQLVNHTSGLADYFSGKARGELSLEDELKVGEDRLLDLTDILEIVRLLRPEFAPGARNGKKAFYSDTNYALLGAIIERTTQASVAEVFKEMIFDPLGLHDTWVFDHTKRQARPADMYAGSDPVVIPYAMSSFAPDGGVVATAADSMEFLTAFFNGKLLTDDELGQMTRRWNRIFYPLRYGYGLMRFKVPRALSPFRSQPALIGHSGSTGSFSFYAPDRGVSIVGTINQMNDPSRPFKLMTSILNKAR